MAIQYPGTIPDLLTRFGLNPLSFTTYTDLLRELQALFNTTGTNPQGTGGTIDGRLDAIEAAIAAPAKAVITANSTAIANSTAETFFSNGGLLVLGNSPVVGRVWRITAGGFLSTMAGSPGLLTFRLRYGNTTSDALLANLNTNANPITASLVNMGWFITALLTVRTVGATGTAIGTGMGETDPLSLTLSNTVTAPATINTTVDKTLSLSAQWSVANAGNTITMTSFLAEQVN